MSVVRVAIGRLDREIAEDEEKAEGGEGHGHLLESPFR